MVCVILFALQRYQRLNQLVGACAAFLLLLLSWRLPINSPIFLGIPRVPALLIGDSLLVLGRRFFIDSSLTAVLSLVYLAVLLWFLAAFITQVQPLYIPLCFTISVLLVASIAVDPPLYSALFIVLAALASIPLFSPPGHPISSAALRLLVFQVLGMGLFLFADWYITSILTGEEVAAQASLAVGLLGLGIAFMAGLFPFHTWIPMIAGASAPLPSSFVIFFLPFASCFAGLRYLAALSQSAPGVSVQPALTLLGIVMVMVGGSWAVVERHLGRLLAFAMLIQIGCWLLAVTPSSQAFVNIPASSLFFRLLIPQILALVLWAVSLDLLSWQQGGEMAENLQVGRASTLAPRFPFLAAGLVVANLSLAGLPVLANFPYLLVISAQIALTSTFLAALFWLGHIGLLAAALHTLAVVSQQVPDGSWKVGEKGYQVFFLVFAILAVILLPILAR